MFHKHSLTGRMAISLGVGLLFGGILFITLPLLGAEVSLMFRAGLLLMYAIMSMFIGLMGIFTTHPIFGFKMNFWMRGIVLGFIFHVMLVFLAHSQIATLMEVPFIAWFGFTSPFWILIDGMVYATVISWAGVHFAGEGNLPVT